MSREDHPGRQYIHPDLLQMIDEGEKGQWVFMKDLKAGDILEVITMNSIYTMRVVDPERGEVLIASNSSRYINEEVRGVVAGTTLTGTGTMVKIGGITPLLRLVLWAEGCGTLVLSATQEVRLNGERVLPVIAET